MIECTQHDFDLLGGVIARVDLRGEEKSVKRLAKR